MKTRSVIKKAVIVFACVGFGFLANAQFSFAPRISVGAGFMSYSSSDPSYADVSICSKPGVSFGLGCEARYRLAKIFSIHSGIFYQMLKSKIELEEEGYKETWDQTANYINIPIEAVYGCEQGFYGGLGVNIGIGMGGKSKWSYTESFLGQTYSESGESDIKFDGKKWDELTEEEREEGNHHLKQINPALSVKAGWTFGKMCVGVDAVVGFSNLDPNPDQKVTVSSVCAHFAYVFGGAGKEKK